MFWYFVAALLSILLIWNRILRQKVQRIQMSTPELYEAARNACLSLNITSSDFLDKVESIPLGHFVLVLADLDPESAPHWSSLNKLQKDAASFCLMADSFHALEIRYVQLFMTEREREFFSGMRNLDPRGLRER